MLVRITLNSKFLFSKFLMLNENSYFEITYKHSNFYHKTFFCDTYKYLFADNTTITLYCEFV